MDTIFLNSENNKTSDPHGLVLNRAFKTNLKNALDCRIFVSAIHGETWKSLNMKPGKTKTTTYQPQHEMRN